MNPVISKISEHDDIYKFTLSGVDKSVANAIRRTILSDVPTTVIHTDSTGEPNQCNITINTCRLHNEIVKHRLSCIPIHNKELDLAGKYILDINVKNDTENMIYVTTEDFRIVEKASGKHLAKEEVQKIFPPNKKTGYYIDLVRLRPKVIDTIPGEQLQLTAEFSVSTSKTNNMFNVVSKCAYGNTVDVEKANAAWEEHLSKLVSEGAEKHDIEAQKKNFYILDVQRHCVKDSFDFVIQTIGIYSNRKLVKMAAKILIDKLDQIVQSAESDELQILPGEVSFDHCYDIVLENEDYTLGPVLQYILYEKFYVGDKTLSFCGFKKFHPHNLNSTIRLAYNEKTDMSTIKFHLKTACMDVKSVFETILSMF